MRNPLLRSLTPRVKGFGISLLVTFLLAAAYWPKRKSPPARFREPCWTQTAPRFPGPRSNFGTSGTNLVRNLTTDEDGRFVALQLPPGQVHRHRFEERLRHHGGGES